MFKRYFKSVIAILLAVAVMCTFAGCTTTLNGTYTNDDGLVTQSFTFDRDGNVKMSAFGIDVQGTYVIEDGEITITYSLLSFSYDWTQTFERKGNSIFIDGTEFVKLAN